MSNRYLESSSITHGSLSASGTRVGLVVGSFPGRMDSCDGSPGRSRCYVGVTVYKSLHRMSTEVMQLVFGQGFFPSSAVDDVAPVPRVHRASTQMAAMGLWCPPIGPGGPGLDTVSHCDDCPDCSECSPRLTG